MSILARVLERLGNGETSLETYDRQGDLVHRLRSRELLDVIRAHRPAFAAARAGDDPRMALLFRSDEAIEFLVAVFAAIAEGFTVVPLYPSWTEEQIQLYLTRYGLRALAVGAGFRSRAEGWPSVAGRVIPVAARVPEGRSGPSPGGEVFPRSLPDDHPCVLIFTSGTSGGLAKLTRITQANLAAAIENIARLEFLHPGMVLHCPLSASHIFAFVVILGFLGIAPRRVIFSDVQFLARIPQERIGKVDAMILIPLVMNRLRSAFYDRIERPDQPPRTGERADPSLERLKRIPPGARRALKRLVGAAEGAVVARETGRAWGFLAWPLVLLARRLLGRTVRRRLASPEFVVVGGAKPSLASMAFLEVMGIRCLQGWGMTETTGPLAVCRLRDRFRGAFGTCGDLFTGARAVIDGEELVVEGPQIAAGYVEPDGTLVAFGGRVRTGDFAAIDSRGRLKILGKVSDRITLTNGLNYDPTVFEEKLRAGDLRREHLLEEAVVIGDGQARLGCVFFLREPHEPGEGVRGALAALLREVNAGLAVDEQIGPFTVSPQRLREAGVLSASAKLIRRRVEERHAHIFEEKVSPVLAVPRPGPAGVR